MNADDFARDARMLCELVIEVGRYADDGPLDDERVFTAYAALEEARQVLAVAQGTLASRLAESMGDNKRLTIVGVGTFEKHRKTDRKQWDTEALLHDVLDTKRVDPETGEVADETPIEKVLEVWNLGAPRITAVRGRALDPDDYCHVDRGGLTLQVIR